MPRFTAAMVDVSALALDVGTPRAYTAACPSVRECPLSVRNQRMAVEFAKPTHKLNHDDE